MSSVWVLLTVVILIEISTVKSAYKLDPPRYWNFCHYNHTVELQKKWSWPLKHKYLKSNKKSSFLSASAVDKFKDCVTDVCTDCKCCCHNHPVNHIPPMLRTHLQLDIALNRRTVGRKLGTFKKQCFLKPAGPWIENYSHWSLNGYQWSLSLTSLKCAIPNVFYMHIPHWQVNSA